MRLSRISRDPLVHFVLIGAAVFAVHGMLAGPESSPDQDRIVVTAGEIERLSSFWEKRRLRPPSADELDGLIAEFVREEVLYREALALGLDRDDAVIRRLLRQKYEFVTQDLAVAPEPDAADLAAWYEVNRERYRSLPRLSFSQVYFNTDRRGAGGERDAMLVLAELRAGGPHADPVGPGDGALLDESYRDSTVPEIAALFGQEFADALAELEPGVWSGPVRSGYGLHLVRVEARREGEAPPFQALEQKIRSDWAYEQRRQANDAVFARLLERYDLEIEDTPVRTDATGGGARP